MKFKHLVLSVLSLSLVFPVFASEAPKGKSRTQWTIEEARQWEAKVGIIKGVNGINKGSYPGMSTLDVIRRASDLGFNSIRVWVNGKTAKEQIAFLKEICDWAGQCNMTVSPVLAAQRNDEFFKNENEAEGLKAAEIMTKEILTAFRDDPRIILWDIWNEPNFGPTDPITFKSMDWIEQMVHWCWEVGVTQAITSSIFWDTGKDKNTDVERKAFNRRCEVENLMDVHNFHNYECGHSFGAAIEYLIDVIRSINERPIVCTECMIATNGSDLPRTLSSFARNHVHFYVWGLFNSDANWAQKWGRSTYDPYDSIFHDMIWADGDCYDYRNVEWLRNFKFIDRNDSIDPGLEYTERWSHDRVWRKMSCGPVKGICADNAEVPSCYNSVRVKFNFSDWKADKDSFYSKVDNLLKKAGESGVSVFPVLLNDDDASADALELAGYVAEVIRKYYDNGSIQAWDLYWHPGEKCTDNAKVSKLVTTIFKYARNEYATQPLTATPCVRIKDFAPDFDYEQALVHGRRRGWDMLEYPGASDVELVNKIWSISDVISFSTSQPQAEAGWLLSICNRYGRPVFCTEMDSPSNFEANKTLERFAMSHVYWYTGKTLDIDAVKNFKFKPIITKH